MRLFKVSLRNFITAAAWVLATASLASTSDAAIYQWAVRMKGAASPETGAQPQAFLWIPPSCVRVNAIVVAQHNLLEEPLLENDRFRKALSTECIGEVWITPMFDTVFDFNNGAGDRFKTLFETLASESGYSELSTVPIIPIGHSAAASFPWNFAAWAPSRTLAIISLKGDAPLTNMTGSGKPNPDWGDRNLDGTPGLMIMGEYEWLDGRLAPALIYQKNHPKALISLYADVGRGHFDLSDDLVNYIGLFIVKAAKARLPRSSAREIALSTIDPTKGWRADRWHMQAPETAPPAPYLKYKGELDQSFWYFDKQMATLASEHYQSMRGKAPQLIGFTDEGGLIPQSADHAQISIAFKPLDDGITFKLSTAYYDKVPEGSANPSRWTGLAAGSPLAHSKGPIVVTRETGPVIQTSPDTWAINFSRVGFDNKRRATDVWFVATQAGDTRYKSAVQQALLRFPIKNETGLPQSINFTLPATVSVKKTKSLDLNGKSDLGLQVHYYVKQGPAEVSGNRLSFAKIPRSSKRPIQVTVVAWQYGISGKIQSAAPAQRSLWLWD